MSEMVRYTVYLIAVAVSFLMYAAMGKWNGFSVKKGGKEKYYFLLLPAALALLAVLFVFRGENVSIFRQWKELCAVGLLWVIACIDVREHLIPNRYLLLGLGMRTAVFAVEAVTDMEMAVDSLILEGIGCLLLLTFCMLLRILSRKGLGMGDVKLFALLPLFLGLLNGVRTLLYAMVIIFIQSCVCLLSKKKSKEDVLPFAPAIAGGAWLAILISVA